MQVGVVVKFTHTDSVLGMLDLVRRDHVLLPDQKFHHKPDEGTRERCALLTSAALH